MTFVPPGVWDGHASALHHGSVRPEEQTSPSGQRTRCCGSPGAAHWDFSGQQQRLRHQPHQRYRTEDLHRHCWLGGRSFQVCRRDVLLHWFILKPFPSIHIESLLRRKQKPYLKLNTGLSGSAQVWKWVVVGAYNCSLCRRIIGCRALQDHGGNAPPRNLHEGRRAGGGGERPSRETRKHQH